MKGNKRRLENILYVYLLKYIDSTCDGQEGAREKCILRLQSQESMERFYIDIDGMHARREFNKQITFVKTRQMAGELQKLKV